MTTPTVEVIALAGIPATVIETLAQPLTVEIIASSAILASLPVAAPIVIDVLQQIGPQGSVGLTGLTGLTGSIGPVGTTGLTGPAGSVGTVVAVFFSQQTASSVWIFAHPFLYKPDVELYDNAGNPIQADVTFPNATTVRVDWASPTTGSARVI